VKIVIINLHTPPPPPPRDRSTDRPNEGRTGTNTNAHIDALESRDAVVLRRRTTPNVNRRERERTNG
jgi:hypothetical protein